MRKRAPRFGISQLVSGDIVTLRLGPENHTTEETMTYLRREVDYSFGSVSADEAIFSFTDRQGKTREMSVYRYLRRWAYGMDAEPVRIEKVVRTLNADGQTYMAFHRAEGAY